MVLFIKMGWYEHVKDENVQVEIENLVKPELDRCGESEKEFL